MVGKFRTAEKLRGRSLLRRLLLIVLATISQSVSGTAIARDFLPALPGYHFHFPQDHAAHEDYRTEWWYYTGHLTTDDHRHFGYEVTFFRTGVASASEKESSPWKLSDVYLAHFAVSDIDHKEFRFFEKLNRGGLGLAGANTDNFYVWNETWFVEQLGKQTVLRAQTPELSIHLSLEKAKPEVVHGKDGISQKATGKGYASHYYSLTRLNTDGYVYIGGKPLHATGTSWMDHEFGSNQLTKEQVGWDWFSIQLANNTELMLYVMRTVSGGIDPNSSGTVIYSDGSSKHLGRDDFKVAASEHWKSPTSGGIYPMTWEIEVPSELCKLKVSPAFASQELTTTKSTGVTYWEGAAKATGTMRGKTVSGESYVEMTGYAEKFKEKL